MNYLDKILKKAEVEHDKLKHPYVGTEHLLLALLSEENTFTDSLKDYNLTYNKFKRKLKEIIGEGSKKSEYVLYTPMLRKVLDINENEDDITNEILFNSLIETNEGIAIRILESMNIDLNAIKIESKDLLECSDTAIKHRDKEINEILQILMRKNKCNPLLIGKAGVGKTAIIEEIQRRLLNNEVPEKLRGYKIINVDVSSLVAGTKYRGDFESKINKLLSSVEHSKKILFIDEIHTLVNAGGAEGAISAGDIIKPYLSRGNIKCIGATTINEYHECFKCDEALNRRFQTILINEPNIECTIDILNNIKQIYERFHNLKIDNNLISEIAYISNKYFTNKQNPDKSIELLDSCCTNALFYEEKKVSSNNLYRIIENRYGLNLCNTVIKKILDNKEILISSKEIIKKLNNINDSIIVFDGDDYNNEDDLNSIFGNPIYKNQNYLLKEIMDRPLGIISFINCSCNKVLREFIDNIIKYRYVIDNYGNKIHFDNYIIIIEKNNNIVKIGFNIESNLDLHFVELDDKLLLTI